MIPKVKYCTRNGTLISDAPRFLFANQTNTKDCPELAYPVGLVYYQSPLIGCVDEKSYDLICKDAMSETSSYLLVNLLPHIGEAAVSLMAIDVSRL